jgi:mRNA interferase YafQ
MTLAIRNIKQFKKDLKRYIHQKPILKDLEVVIKILANEEPLDKSYRDHPLKGNWNGYRECHVRGDLLLVYKIDKEENILYLVAFGSHAEVLEM